MNSNQPTGTIRPVWNRSVAFMKSNKKALLIAAGVIVAILIVLFATVWRGVWKSSNNPADEAPKGLITDNRYDPATFTTQVVSGVSGAASVAVTVPVTGEKKLDPIIQSEANKFATAAAGALGTGSASYNYEARAYKNFLFITLNLTQTSNSQKPIPLYQVLGFYKTGAVDYSKYLKPGYETIATTEVSNTLAQRFQMQLEDTSKLASTAITNKNFRLAVNGLVVLVPSKTLPGLAGGPVYYEVLVDKSKLGDTVDF